MSSGSNCSDSVVKPTRSAKRTVTIRRSTLSWRSTRAMLQVRLRCPMKLSSILSGHMTLPKGGNVTTA